MKKKIWKIIPISTIIPIALIVAACSNIKHNNNTHIKDKESQEDKDSNKENLNDENAKEKDNDDNNENDQSNSNSNDSDFQKETNKISLIKLENFWQSNDFEFFNNIKKSINEHKNDITSQENVDDIIEFLKLYLKIANKDVLNYDLKLLENKVIINEIVNELDKYDQIINDEKGFLNINKNTIKEIEKTSIKIDQRNEEIKTENNNYKLFVNKVKNYDWKNKALANKVFKNIEFIYSNLNERTSFFEKLNSIESKITNILNIKLLYKRNESNNEYSRLINFVQSFIQDFEGVDFLNDIESRLISYENELKNIIHVNSWIPSDLKRKVHELEQKILRIENISQEKQEELNNLAQNIVTYQQFYSLNKEYNSVANGLFLKKQELKNKISLSMISYENKQSLNEIIEPIEELDYLDNLIINFDELIESFSKTKKVVENIRQKIANNNFKSRFQLEFYKKLVMWNKLSNNDILDQINLLNMAETTQTINNLKQNFENILANEANTETDEDDLIALFKKETQNKWTLNLSENAAKYDLEPHATSASISLEVANILYDKFDTEEVDFEIISVELDEYNKNKLNITTKVYLKSNPDISYKINSFKIFGNEDINKIVNEIEVNNLDQFFNVKYDELKKITKSEFENFNYEKKLSFFEPKSKWVKKYFKPKLLDNFEILNERVFVTFNIMFNNQAIKSAKIPTIKKIDFSANEKEKQKIGDLIDEKKILDIIMGDTTNFITKVKIKKGAPYSHIHYLASDAIKAFHELYDLPKFGKYEIFIKDIRNVDDWRSTADLILWYKKDGVEVPITNEREVYSHLKRIGSFKPLDFYDIKPNNGSIFTAADFVTEHLPDQSIIDVINSINESNFKLRLAWGDNRRTTYRSLNPKDMIDQQAFIKMEYVLELKNGENRHSANFDNQTYVPLNAGLYEKEIDVNNMNLNNLRSNYFVYYYDVRLTGKRGMTFKLGFINKRNQSIRYTTTKEFTLINLVNDFQQTLYPEIMLNNIKLSDLKINNELLNLKTASYFQNNLQELNEIITLKGNNDNNIDYKNFSLPTNLFKIVELKRIIGNEAYVKFAVENRNGVQVHGNNWYKISGFANDIVDNSLENLNFRNQNLKTLYDSTTSITRERIIEPYWKDLLWELNTKTNIATWTLKRKYLELTLLKPNSKNRYISFEILSGPLIKDGSMVSRIRNFDNATKISLNFDDLILKKYLKFKRIAFNGVDNFNYYIEIKWNENSGIEFKVSMEDNSNKIIVDEPETQTFKSGVAFDKNRAFLILPEATKTTIKYTNDDENEDFGINQNRFNYNEVDYNQYNQPILFSNDLEFQRDKSVYYPNQNVDYKLHEGYKLDADFLRVRQYRGWNVVDSVYARNVLIDGNTWFGTLSFIGKANNDPDDAKFYVLTNRHVESWGKKFDSVTGSNFLANSSNKKIAFAPEIIGSNVENYFNLRTSSTNTMYGTPSKRFWTAVEQVSKNGVNKTERDLTIILVDLNEKLKQAHRSGNMQIVWKIQNLIWKGNSKIDIESKIRTISVPHILETATLGWPGTNYAGSILRRPENRHDYSYIKYKPNYVQIFTGSGGSGSGIYIDDDYYFATWAIGAGEGRSGAPTYDDRNYNFFGVNWNNENPLEVSNYNSVAAQIFRANMLHPDQFDLPWFLKKVREGGK